MKIIFLGLVLASNTPLQCGGSLWIFGELCKYGFNSSGKGGTGQASVPTSTLETNKWYLEGPSERIWTYCRIFVACFLSYQTISVNRNCMSLHKYVQTWRHNHLSSDSIMLCLQSWKTKKGAKNKLSCYLPSGFLCLIKKFTLWFSLFDKKYPNGFRNSWIDYKLRNWGVVNIS